MKKSYDFSKARRGAVIPTPGKLRITIRIDGDVLDWFRKEAHDAGGGNYQTMMNKALRDHMDREEEPLEETFRRVLREVLPGSARRPARGQTSSRKTSRKKSTRKK